MKASMRLYELADQHKALADKLMELDLDAQTVADTLDAESGDLEQKIVATIAVAESIAAEAAAVKAAADRMVARHKALERRAESLREYVAFNMQRADVKEVKTQELSVKLQQKPGKVVVDDETKVPASFWREKVVREIDKAGALEWLRDGAEIPGCHLEVGYRIVIK